MLATTHNTIGRGLSNRAINGGTDDYFTPPDVAMRLVAAAKVLVPSARTWIEPSAGAGVFLDAARVQGIVARGYDINPRTRAIIKRDWLACPAPSADVVFGNPPFGFAASLAVRFFNQAACTGAKAIAFVLPASFRKTSVRRRLSHEYSLAFESSETVAFDLPDGGVRSVPCVLQVWVRAPRQAVAIDDGRDMLTWCSAQAGADVAIRRVGGRAGEVLNLNEQPLSPSSTYFIKARSKRILRLLKTLDFTQGRDNTAGVRSVAKSEIVDVLRGAMS